MTTVPPIEIPDAWKLDSGLRDDMVISVHSAYFAPHADYQDGQQLMLWLIGTDENEEPVDIRLSIGADWETTDGNLITHPTKRKQHINRSSIYGFWLDYAFEIPQLARVLIDRGSQLGSGPTDARVWINLILHLQLKPLHWGGTIPDQDRLMPTEYFGLTTDTTTATVPPVQAPAPVAVAPAPPAAPVAAPPVAPPADNGTANPADVVALARQAAAARAAAANGSPLYARALELAKAAPDFATFVGQALSDDEILADDELANRCADETEIWAQAH